MSHENIVETFCAKAAVVGAHVVIVNTEDEAIDYVLHITAAKKPCDILSKKTHTSDKSPATSVQRIVTAPGLTQELYDKLDKACVVQGHKCIDKGLRAYLTGVDIGFTVAECAIAASGTCLVNADCEEKRLATMLSDICILIVKESTIYPDLFHTTPILRRMQQEPSAHSTFISGPSRTADIERVPAVGVHGPLEQHVIIIAHC